MKKLTTIADAYQHYLELVGDTAGHAVRTRDELQDQIHQHGLRYEQIDDQFWHQLFESGWAWSNADDDVACSYCGRFVPPQVRGVPAVHNDGLWEALAFYHADDCEWITTRAHRINVEDADDRYEVSYVVWSETTNKAFDNTDDAFAYARQLARTSDQVWVTRETYRVTGEGRQRQPVAINSEPVPIPPDDDPNFTRGMIVQTELVNGRVRQFALATGEEADGTWTMTIVEFLKDGGEASETSELTFTTAAAALLMAGRIVVYKTLYDANRREGDRSKTYAERS